MRLVPAEVVAPADIDTPTVRSFAAKARPTEPMFIDAPARLKAVVFRGRVWLTPAKTVPTLKAHERAAWFSFILWRLAGLLVAAFHFNRPDTSESPAAQKASPAHRRLSQTNGQ